MKGGGRQNEGRCRGAGPREGGEAPPPVGQERAGKVRKDEVQVEGGGEWNTG